MDRKAEFVFIIRLPFWLRLPDGDYKGKRGNSSYMIGVRCVDVQPDSDDRAAGTGKLQAFVATGGAQVTGAARMPGSQSRYTEMQIGFAMDVPGDAIASKEHHLARDCARTYVNHFLDVYRLLAEDIDVHPLTQTAFHTVREGQGLTCRVLAPLAPGKKQLQLCTVFDEDNPVRLSVALLDEEAQRDIRRAIEEGKEPPLTRLLLLDAESYLTSGDTRLAVIECSAALDLVVEQKAMEILMAEGKSGEEASRRLDHASTSRIIGSEILPRLAVDPPSEIDEWARTHRGLRNQVVHDALQPTKEQARQAVDCARSLCVFVSSLSGDFEDRRCGDVA